MADLLRRWQVTTLLGVWHLSRLRLDVWGDDTSFPGISYHGSLQILSHNADADGLNVSDILQYCTGMSSFLRFLVLTPLFSHNWKTTSRLCSPPPLWLHSLFGENLFASFYTFHSGRPCCRGRTIDGKSFIIFRLFPSSTKGCRSILRRRSNGWIALNPNLEPDETAGSALPTVSWSWE